MFKFPELILLMGHHCFLDFILIGDHTLETYSNEASDLNPRTITTVSDLSQQTVADKNVTQFSRFIPVSCSSSIIFFNASSNPHHLHVLKHLESQQVLRQHPDYVILVSELTLAYNLQVVFKYIHISSQYLFVHLALNKAYSVCLWCSLCSFQHFGLLEIDLASDISTTDAFKAIDNVWWKLHKNMSHSEVFTQRKSLELFLEYFPPDCDHLDHNFEGDSRLCILQLLSQRLNYDFIYRRSIHNNLNVEDVYNDIVSSSNHSSHREKVTANSIDNWQASSLYRDYFGKITTKMMWIPWGWMKDPLSFIMVFRKSSLKDSALLRPFDTITWLLLLASIILMSSVLTFSLWTYRAYYLHKQHAMNSLLWRNSLLMTLGAIMEQNPSELTAKKNVLSFRISFQTWLLVSIIITNAYTGIVISFLCSDILPPDLPNDFKELIEKFQNFPIISVDYIYIPELDSVLHYSSGLIREYIGILEAYQGKNSLSVKSNSYYKKINSDTIYIDVENKKVPVIYERGITVPDHINSLNQSYKFPVEFTFISTKSGTKFFNYLMQENHDVITWMQPPAAEQKESVFALTAFTVPRNFFYPLVNRYLAWIVESGLPNIWEKKADELIRKWNQQDLGCWKEVKNMTIFWEDSNCIKTTTTKTHAFHQHHEEQFIKPLKIESLFMPIVLCFAGLGFCLISFSFEICTGGMWRKVKLWYWIHKELNSAGTQNLRPLHVPWNAN